MLAYQLDLERDDFYADYHPSLNFEAKVKNMGTMSQELIQEGYQTGLQAGIEAGRNQVLPQLEAAKARTAKARTAKARTAEVVAEKDEIAAEKTNLSNQLRLTISALRAQGASLESFSQLLKTPIEALQSFLLQDSPASKPTLH